MQNKFLVELRGGFTKLSLFLFLSTVLFSCKDPKPLYNFDEFTKNVAAKNDTFLTNFKFRTENGWSDDWKLVSADTQIYVQEDLTANTKTKFVSCQLEWAKNDNGIKTVRSEKYTLDGFPNKQTSNSDVRLYKNDTLIAEGWIQFWEKGRTPTLTLLTYLDSAKQPVLYECLVRDSLAEPLCSYYSKERFNWLISEEHNKMEVKLSNDSAVYKKGDCAFVKLVDDIAEDQPKIVKQYNDSVIPVFNRMMKQKNKE